MPYSTSPVGHVRIMRCEHGTNYVTLGPVTLHLTDPELVLLDRTIHKLAQRQPVLQQALLEGLCCNNAAARDGHGTEPFDGEFPSGTIPADPYDAGPDASAGGASAAGQP